MGASAFQVISQGSSVRAAFKQAVEDAQWNFGDGGYTGTIAEKSSFKEIPLSSEIKTTRETIEYSEKLIDSDDSRVCDKWGRAGCIKLPNKEDHYLFFGWASS